jgi:hypothetical protein
MNTYRKWVPTLLNLLAERSLLLLWGRVRSRGMHPFGHQAIAGGDFLLKQPWSDGGIEDMEDG